MTEIDRDRLVIGAELARGGQGAVFPVDGGKQILKEYFPHIDVDYAVLARFPGAFAQLPATVRARLAHPSAVVRGPSGPTGFLMPPIPARFFLPNSREKQLQHLLNGPAYATGLGIEKYTQGQVYLLLADLADTLDRLHAAGIAVGDISPKNALISFEPDPTVFLIDCDSMSVHGQTALAPVTTPDWTAPHPAGDNSPTPASDAYKFGLVVLRVLTGDQQTTDPATLPAAVPATIQALAAAALSTDPDARARPADWVGPLTAAAATAGDLITTQAARPVGPAVPTRPIGRHGAKPVRATGPSPAPPAGPPPAPAASPAPRRRGGLLVAAFVVFALITAFVRMTGGDDPAPPERPSNRITATAAPTPIATTTTAPPTTSWTTTTTAPPRTTHPSVARSLPSDLLTCRSTTSWKYRPDETTEYVPLSIGVGDTMPATHCNFAEELARTAGAVSGPVAGRTWNVRSPNTGKTYAMECRDLSATDIVIRCWDGNTAVVYLYY